MATIVRLEASPLAFGRSAAPLPIIIAQRPYQPHHHRPTLSPAARLCGWGPYRDEERRPQLVNDDHGG